MAQEIQTCRCAGFRAIPSNLKQGRIHYNNMHFKGASNNCAAILPIPTLPIPSFPILLSRALINLFLQG